nr:biotin-dependent carboxyltransferase family protein [Corynebacterium lactis]
MENSITIIHPGILTTVQDLGRVGYGSMGVSSSGSFDLESAAAANRMVVNDADAAVLECMIGGLEFRIEQGAIVAFAGAHGPVTVEQDGHKITTSMNSRLVVGAGSTVKVGTFEAGLRGYIAIRGGIDVEPVLGSRSTDTLGKLGPTPLRAGMTLAVGDPAYSTASSIAIYPAPGYSGESVRLDVVPGPRNDWFTEGSIEDFFTETWTLTQESNRVGLRLEGTKPLRRAIDRELASEGMIPGAIQVPSSGQPIIFGPDHPATGGYPVIGALTRQSLSRAGQLVPGAKVRFRRVRLY